MKLTKKEEKILQEYIKIQREFNVLKDHMQEVRDRAQSLLEKLEKIRNKEKALFEKIDKDNGKKEN